MSPPFNNYPAYSPYLVTSPGPDKFHLVDQVRHLLPPTHPTQFNHTQHLAEMLPQLPYTALNHQMMYPQEVVNMAGVFQPAHPAGGDPISRTPMSESGYSTPRISHEIEPIRIHPLPDPLLQVPHAVELQRGSG